MKVFLIIVVIVLLAGLAGFAWLGHSSRSNPPRLGLSGDQFAPCPASPNCVSSDTDSPDHSFPPLPLAANASWAQIVEQVTALPNLKVVSDDGQYLRGEVRSPLFGFVDDLEIHQRGNQLALRSSSRVGYSDLGANRKRAEQLQQALSEAGLLQ
ncbi:MAG: DUF1499 domain-containing protein [Xanthomonadales bacterium]|nr:DUF1499 domain-containing protein [Xanthomonadales bacterium]